jgi:putative membrane protein
MMHSDFYSEWFCGPSNFFPGLHGGLFHLLLWGLGLYLFYRLIRTVATGNRPSPSDPTGQIDPLAILERRYAKGEIDQEEFRQRKEDLGL